MKKNCIKYIFFLTIALSLVSGAVFAKTDLSIVETDITFSKEKPLAGETVRIYARVFNTGDVDVSGHVVFLDNGKEITEPQVVSVRVGNYDDVFVDWNVKAGNHDIKVNLVGLNPKDEDLTNNTTTKKDILVDIDTDKDGTSDTKDTDIDNDGLTNEQEAAQGTDPSKVDTDGDGVNDNIDAFPKDATEIRDTDKDGLGDNKDLDDDGDGIFDEDEIYKYGSNPLNTDTDSDGVDDKKEVEIGTSMIKLDTDGDNVKDSEDKYPLDPTKFQASILDSIANLFGGDKTKMYWALGILSALIIAFLMFGGRRRRRK